MSQAIHQSTLSPQQKTQIIFKELESNNVYPDTVLAEDNFLELLDKRLGGRTFDRSVAAQLYDRITKDTFGRFTAGEFVHVFLEAESVLRDRLHQIDDTIADDERKRLEIIEKLENIKKTETLNQYGVMNGSKLHVVLHEFQYASPRVPRNVFVDLSYEQSRARSKVVEYNVKATWNEEFDLDVISGIGDVVISVYGSNQIETPELLGELRIPLQKLKDQEIQEGLFELSDRNGHLVGGKIQLQLYWIFSRVKYLNDLTRKWDDDIRMQYDDRNDTERNLKVLYALFSNLQAAYPKPTQKKLMAAPTSNMTHLQKTVSPVKEKFHLPEDDRFNLETELPWGQLGPWGYISSYSSLALLVLSMFACFFKASYADILLSLAFLVNFDTLGKFRGTPEKVYGLYLGAFAAVGLEIIWLIVYSRTWYTPMRAMELSTKTSRFIYVIVLFCLTVKILILVAYYKFSKHLRDMANRHAMEAHQSRLGTNVLRNY